MGAVAMSGPPPGFVLDDQPPPQQPAAMTPPEGFVLDEQAAQKGAAPVTAGGLYNALDAGVAKGVAGIGGLLGDASNLGARGIEAATNFVTDYLGKERYQPDRSKSVLNNIPTSETVGKAVQEQFYGGAKPYEPQNTAEKFTHVFGEFAPGIMGGGGATAVGRRLLTNVAAPAVGSEAAGQVAEKIGPEGSAPWARAGGAVVGALAPSALSRVITPLPTNATRNAAVNTLRNDGVTDITAGQATGRGRLRYFEAERGAGANLAESAGEQFTAAALRRAGINANRATPEVIDDAFTRIGQEFDYLAQTNRARVDHALVGDLRTAVADYNNMVSAPNRTPAVLHFLEEINNTAQRTGGNIPGEAYQSLRSRMERAARGMGNNPEARNAIRDMRNALDDAMERSIRAAGRPDDLAAWQQARREYRNMIVIEQAATGAGEGAASGLISPAKLRQATVSKQGRRNYARGEGDFADLARAGEQVMTPLPNSGTAGRLNAQNMGMGASTIVGSLLGTAAAPGVGTAVGGAAGALAGMAVPRVAGALATSGAGRWYLGNQVMTGAQQNLTPRQSALVAALMAAEQQRLQQSGQR